MRSIMFTLLFVLLPIFLFSQNNNPAALRLCLEAHIKRHTPHFQL
jgi:hypothetical protein